MKKVLFLFSFLMGTVSTFGQQQVGSWSLKPTVGGTLSSYIGNDADDMKNKLGLAAGVEIGYQATDMFGISVGVIYTQQGCKVDEDELEDYTGYDLKAKMETEYINVPVLANFYVAKGFALKTGLQFGFLTKAEESVRAKGGISANVDIKDALNTFDLSIPVGLSYEVSGFVIDARYHFGLMRPGKEKYTFQGQTIYDDENNAYNSVFMLTLGYKFTL